MIVYSENENDKNKRISNIVGICEENVEETTPIIAAPSQQALPKSAAANLLTENKLFLQQLGFKLKKANKRYNVEN